MDNTLAQILTDLYAKDAQLVQQQQLIAALEARLSALEGPPKEGQDAAPASSH